MKLFLTSSPCTRNVPDGCELNCVLDKANGFVEKLQQAVGAESRCLIISSDPENHEMSVHVKEDMEQAFAHAGMKFLSTVVCDSRNEQQIGQLIADSDLIILSGGHVPTENAFFMRIGLKEKIKDYAGVVIGISAGTMNSAEVVYAQPELEGEVDDPSYERFIAGLGLTKLMIVPHYQMIKDVIIDGKKIFEDVTYGDSAGRKIYCLIDGSYVLVEAGVQTLYGEAYLIEDGVMEQITQEGDVLEL